MALKDYFFRSERQNENRPPLVAPAENAYSITPADSDLTFATRALYIGGSGDVKVITSGGDTVTFEGVLAGSILPIRCHQVMAATTATAIVGMY